MGLLTAACTGDAASTSTSVTVSSTTTASVPATSTTVVETTTTSQGEAGFPVVALPTDAACSLGDVPGSGEATVVVDGRLYGLGASGADPRCLADGIDTADIEWGPQGDRIRVGARVLTATGEVPLPGATEYIWTAPTGSRILAVAPDRLWKVDLDDLTESDITFLSENDAAAYHPAGEHILVIGTNTEGQYGLWLATNQGGDPLLIAFDELAEMSVPEWSWLNEPMFIAKHINGPWHIHLVELSAEGSLEGPVVLETDESIDMLLPARHDPIMLAFRSGGVTGVTCVEGSHAGVKGVDLPEPVASLTSTPLGWLSAERLLVMTYPNGCEAPGDLWSFSAGFCPGSVYGVTPIISGIDSAAAREAAPLPPPPPDFTGIIDPAPA
jgi:hypothetical protein